MVPVEESRLLPALIPDAHLVLLETANHILLEQEPAWDVFRSQIEAFLGADTQPSPPIAAGDRLMVEQSAARRHLRDTQPVVPSGLPVRQPCACPRVHNTAKGSCRRLPPPSRSRPYQSIGTGAVNQSINSLRAPNGGSRASRSS